MIATFSLVVAVLSAIVSGFATYVARHQRDSERLAAGVAAELSAVSPLSDALAMLQPVYAVFLDRPHLRQFFYDGAPPPPPGTDDRIRIEIVSEMLADVLESAIDATIDVARFRRHQGDWHEYARFLLTNSEVSRDYVLESKIHPHLSTLAASPPTN